MNGQLCSLFSLSKKIDLLLLNYNRITVINVQQQFKLRSAIGCKRVCEQCTLLKHFCFISAVKNIIVHLALTYNYFNSSVSASPDIGEPSSQKQMRHVKRHLSQSVLTLECYRTS